MFSESRPLQSTKCNLGLLVHSEIESRMKHLQEAIKQTNSGTCWQKNNCTR